MTKSPPIGLCERTELWVITFSNEDRWFPWLLRKKPIWTSDLNFSSILSFISGKVMVEWWASLSVSDMTCLIKYVTQFLAKTPLDGFFCTIPKAFSSFETGTLWSFLNSGSISFQTLTTVWQYNIIWKIDIGSWWHNGQTSFVLCHLL